MNNHQLTRATGFMHTTADEQHSPEAAAELGSLRGSMYAMIPALPDRYSMSPHADRPAVVITDTVDSAREPLIVGLCDSHGASHMLTFLNRCEWAGEGQAPDLVEAFTTANAFVVYTDRRSGESQKIGLCNLCGARKVLAWLGLASERINLDA